MPPPDEESNAIGNVTVYALLRDHTTASNVYNTVAGYGTGGGILTSQDTGTGNFSSSDWHGENTVNWWGRPYIWAKPNNGFQVESIRQTGNTLSSSTSYKNYNSLWTTKYSTTNVNSCVRTTDVVLAQTAQYAVIFERIPYIIAYYANGGSGSMANQTKYYGISTKLNPNNFSSPPGTHFAGWATGPGSNTVTYSNGATITTNSTLYLYAVWEANTYTINYNLSGGSHGTYHPSSATTGTAFQISNPTRVGYTFTGWEASQELEKSYAKYGTSSITTSSWNNWNIYPTETWFRNLAGYSGGYIDLTARWKPITYNISYELNGGSWPTGYTSSTYHPTTANYDTTINIVHPTKTGYDFSRWMVSGVDSSTAYSGTSSSSLIKYSGGDTDSTYFKNLCSTATNVTFEAVFYPATYTVTLNTNKGSGSTTPTTGTASVTATYNSAMPTSGVTMPTRAGYTFQGYYDTSAATGGTQYYTASGSSARTWNKTSATTLYARWKANEYTVTLEKRGGSGGTTSVTATFDAAMPSITIPSKDGWIFLGYYWSDTPNSTQYYTSYGSSARKWNQTIANPTLYAKWREKTWTEDTSYYSTSLSGQGSETSPYLITSAKDLAYLAKQSQTNTFAGKYFKQTADIDLNAHLWQPIGNWTNSTTDNGFEGYYDGNLYKITNLRIDTDACAGLFGFAKNGELKKIHIVGGTIKTTARYAGGVLGRSDMCMISSCIVDSVQITGDSRIGGIVGIQTHEIRNCVSKNNTLIGNERVGGVVGHAYANIQDCSTQEVNITCSSYANIIYGSFAMNGLESSSLIANYGNGTINGTSTKVMYGNASAWTNWSLVPNVNGGLPVQKSLYHIGGFTSSQEVYNYLTAWKNS